MASYFRYKKFREIRCRYWASRATVIPWYRPDRALQSLIGLEEALNEILDTSGGVGKIAVDDEEVRIERPDQRQGRGR